ncbi:unnamed protein product [Leptidea sinapis]|uniref:Uncharacterized protein n=1 Tax=Leptidea sinapis TaxID=189913 RepID=A0A5E4Q3J4_9NEOP|nr:unnamed protein product [Leptidea sinapis]
MKSCVIEKTLPRVHLNLKLVWDGVPILMHLPSPIVRIEIVSYGVSNVLAVFNLKVLFSVPALHIARVARPVLVTDGQLRQPDAFPWRLQHLALRFVLRALDIDHHLFMLIHD